MKISKKDLLQELNMIHGMAQSSYNESKEALTEGSIYLDYSGEDVKINKAGKAIYLQQFEDSNKLMECLTDLIKRIK